MLDLRTRDRASSERLETLTRPETTAPATPLPGHFKVDDANGLLRISWRWFSPSAWLLTAFAIVWNTIVLLWLGVAVAGGNWGMLCFGSLNAASGIGIGYLAVSNFVNSTVVSLQHGVLQVKHSPLPWFGGGAWRREDLAQLYAEAHSGGSRNQRAPQFALCALLRNGRRVKLLGGLTERAQVLWLESTLERRLDIVDAPVAGEVDKR